MRKFFVIGDIHGCQVPLGELLARIHPDPVEDRMIFLGDYINRGPASKSVIETLLAVKKKAPQTVFLKGNHEDMFLRYLHGRSDSLFLHAGGMATLQSYGVLTLDPEAARQAVPEPHQQFLMNLLPYWEEDNYIFVHAGIEQGRHMSQQRAEWLYWADKERFMGQQFPEVKGVIFGHFTHEQPLVAGNRIGIDCGAVYGGSLVCLILPEMAFVTVKSPVYWPPGATHHQM